MGVGMDVAGGGGGMPKGVARKQCRWRSDS